MAIGISTNRLILFLIQFDIGFTVLTSVELPSFQSSWELESFPGNGTNLTHGTVNFVGEILIKHSKYKYRQKNFSWPERVWPGSKLYKFSGSRKLRDATQMPLLILTRV